MTTSKMNKAFFLDRDGVINIDGDYVSTIEDFQLIDGVFEACKIILSQGYKIIIITNQSGIGRGYYTEEQFFELNRWMIDKFKAEFIWRMCTFAPITQQMQSNLIISIVNAVNLNQAWFKKQKCNMILI